MGDPEDYSIAREGVWGREGLAIAVHRGLADFFFRSFSLLGGLGAVLGRSWGALGFLGRSWGGLGSLLDRSWAVLGRSWASLGPLFAALGPSAGGLGASWGDLGASWGGFGAAGGAKNVDFPCVFQ